MLMLMLTVAHAACGPITPTSPPAQLTLRAHVYTQIGACNGIPVYRTPLTDSTFLDRATTDHAVVLVTDQSRDPTTTEGSWPAPPGNLYFSVPFPGTPAQARAAISTAVHDWALRTLPATPLTEGWSEGYGGHRAPDRRFVTGLVVEALTGGTAIGVDIHLNATPADYEALGAADAHVSAATLTGAPQDIEATLWALLSALLPAPPPP